jgi:hypothetical protein
MTHFASSINPWPVITEILEEPGKNGRIIALQALSPEIEKQLIKHLNKIQIFPADSFGTYEQQRNSRHEKQLLTMWNPTEWKEWDGGDICFLGNVATFIIDNSDTATYIADEIWEINKNGQVEKFAPACLF